MQLLPDLLQRPSSPAEGLPNVLQPGRRREEPGAQSPSGRHDCRAQHAMQQGCNGEWRGRGCRSRTPRGEARQARAGRIHDGAGSQERAAAARSEDPRDQARAGGSLGGGPQTRRGVQVEGQGGGAGCAPPGMPVGASEVPQRGLHGVAASEGSGGARGDVRHAQGQVCALRGADGAPVARGARGELHVGEGRVPERGLQRAAHEGRHEPAPREVRARGGRVLVPGVRRAPASEGHGRALRGDASRPGRFGGEAAAERVRQNCCAAGGGRERAGQLVSCSHDVGVQLARRRLENGALLVRAAFLRGGGYRAMRPAG
mmetsp:Transcript_53817/g.127918  ORF Transcript_53817/g.127918 Transcript_53817/m.127918 type:complete len:316 (+) Transcript_53817:250-1197(+)